MGRLHAQKIKASDEAVLLAVVDPNPDTSLDLPWVADHPAEVDFAVIACPSAAHVREAKRYLERGIPCLVEKPVATSVKEGDLLRGYRQLSINHLERYNPAVRACGAGEELGYFKSTRLGVLSKRSRDVDVVLDLMVHDLDLLLRWTKSPVREVRSVGVSLMGDGLDVVEAWIETESGCVASLTASRVSQKKERSIRVVDQQNYWSLDLLTHQARRTGWSEGGPLGVEVVPVKKEDAITALHKSFFTAVRGEGEFPVPVEEALAAVALAERVRSAVVS